MEPWLPEPVTPIGLPEEAGSGEPGDAAELVVARLAELLGQATRPTTDPITRRGLLQQLLAATVDLDAIARSSLGAAGERLEPGQQEQFREQLGQALVRRATGELAHHGPVQLTILGCREHPRGLAVAVRGRDARSRTAELELILHRRTGDWRLIDLEFDGVSALRNYRARFARALRTAGFPGLLRQVARLGQGTRKPHPPRPRPVPAHP